MVCPCPAMGLGVGRRLRTRCGFPRSESLSRRCRVLLVVRGRASGRVVASHRMVGKSSTQGCPLQAGCCVGHSGRHCLSPLSWHRMPVQTRQGRGVRCRLPMQALNRRASTCPISGRSSRQISANARLDGSTQTIHRGCWCVLLPDSTGVSLSLLSAPASRPKANASHHHLFSRLWAQRRSVARRRTAGKP